MTWYGTTDLRVTSFKQMFDVTLGKMLQTEPAGPTDSLTPYLNSAAVQDGYVEGSNLKSMWASDIERRNLSVRANDLVVCEGGDVGRSALVKADSSAIFQNSVHRVRPRQGSDIRFAKYTLDALRSSSYLDVLCNKATIRHFTADKLANLEVPHAGSDYQKAACDFLDRETAQIDELIGKQERLIELLAEKRQAIITHAVTKGLDPNAPTKPSRIPWIGDVPKEWDVSAAKRVSSLFVPQRDKPELNHDGGYPWITPVNLGQPHPVKVDTFVTAAAARSSQSRTLQKGSVMATCAGRFGLASICTEDVVINQQIHGLIANNEIRPHFLRHAVAIATPYFESIATSTTIPYVNGAGFENMPVPLPPLEMQDSILQAIDSRTSRIDRLLADSRRVVALLTERRSVLISAAVTGKIDVRKEAS